MKSQVNIVVVVDVIGALSDNSLGNGNLCLIDDGEFRSEGQGTAELCTLVQPGQTVQWTALAVDLQTPVDIKSIKFLGSGDNSNGNEAHPGEEPGDADRLELDVWAGVVPSYLTPGVAHNYRLELQMYEGPHSVLSVDAPALKCQ